MFVLIETADVDVLSVALFTNKTEAEARFEALAEQHRVSEWPDEDCTYEAAGTLRLAGDEAYAVQLLEVQPVNTIEFRA